MIRTTKFSRVAACVATAALEVIAQMIATTPLFAFPGTESLGTALVVRMACPDVIVLPTTGRIRRVVATFVATGQFAMWTALYNTVEAIPSVPAACSYVRAKI